VNKYPLIHTVTKKPVIVGALLKNAEHMVMLIKIVQPNAINPDGCIIAKPFGGRPRPFELKVFSLVFVKG
jgi:hypothetical protein